MSSAVDKARVSVVINMAHSPSERADRERAPPVACGRVAVPAGSVDGSRGVHAEPVDEPVDIGAA